jgi:outer membrane biosynthesis protein TonB
LFAARSLSEIEITKMALHRDIFWVGKQWAVTGYGMQAVDQKQKSKFDIEASRLWEDDLLENLSEQRWFNAEDFNAGLSIARAKYPEAPGKAALRKKAAVKESAPAPVAPSKAEPKIESKVTAKAEPKADVKAKPTKSAPAAEPAKPAPKVESPKSESAKPEAAKPQPAPAPSKLSFTGGSTAATLKIGSKARAKKRPPAQFNIRIDGWPAKFTRMWRVRINQQ